MTQEEKVSVPSRGIYIPNIRRETPEERCDQGSVPSRRIYIPNIRWTGTLVKCSIFRPLTGNLYSKYSYLLDNNAFIEKTSVPSRGIYIPNIDDAVVYGDRRETTSVPSRGIYIPNI